MPVEPVKAQLHRRRSWRRALGNFVIATAIALEAHTPASWTSLAVANSRAVLVSDLITLHGDDARLLANCGSGLGDPVRSVIEALLSYKRVYAVVMKVLHWRRRDGDPVWKG